MRLKISVAAAAFAAAFGLLSGSAFAANEVQKECSTKYQAAKAGNQLAGKTWNQFYKECAAEAKAEPAAATPPEPAPAPAPAKPTKAAKKAPEPAPAATGGGAVYPTAVSTEFSKETAGKARFKTCLAQYNANKAKNANAGLKWIEKGGGYYSECNKRLKG